MDEDEEVCQWCGKGDMIPCQSWCYEMQCRVDQESEIYE